MFNRRGVSISMKGLTEISRLNFFFDVWWPAFGIHRSSMPTDVGVEISWRLGHLTGSC